MRDRLTDFPNLLRILLKKKKKKIFLVYKCEVKDLSSLDPLHTGPKAHVEEEETSEDEQRESKLPRDIAKDNPVLSQPKS